MTGMQRLNLLAALLTFLYGAWRGWPVALSLQKGLTAYVVVFAAQILVILGLLHLARGGGSARRP